MKKLLCLLTGLIALSFTTANAQWSQIGYMVTSANDTAKGSHQFRGFGTTMYCATAKGLYQSGDNGNTWNDLTYTAGVTAGRDIYSVFKASNGHVFAGSDKRMFKSTDGGSTWAWLSNLPDSATYYDVVEQGSNMLVSMAKGSAYGVFYSADFGSTWTAASGITSNVRSFFADGTTLYLGGTANGVYKSTDNGQTWTIAGTGFPASAGIWNVMRSGTKLFANSVSGVGLFESSDNGATWTATAASTFTGFCQVFSITQSGPMMLASNDGACNSGGLSSIRMSSDGGVTWSNFLTGTTTPNYYPVLGRNALGTSFFTKKGNGAEAYRYELTTAIAEKSVNTEPFTIFPNPAKTLLNITGNENQQTVQYALYNLYGAVIKSGTFKGSNYTMDVNGFAAGYYVLKLQSDEQNTTLKVVIQ